MFIEDINTEVNIVDIDITADFFHRITDLSLLVAVDIETSGLDFVTDRMATVQVYDPTSNSIEIVRIQQGIVPPRLAKLMHSQITKVFHYSPFDLHFIMRDWRIYPRSIKDTRIAAGFIDQDKRLFFNPAKQRYDHSLISLVYTQMGITLDKDTAISNWFAEDLSKRQVMYAAQDVLYLPTILHQFESQLKPTQLDALIDTYNAVAPDIYYKLNNMRNPSQRY